MAVSGKWGVLFWVEELYYLESILLFGKAMSCFRSILAHSNVNSLTATQKAGFGGGMRVLWIYSCLDPP